jgi:hypothetical protein
MKPPIKHLETALFIKNPKNLETAGLISAYNNTLPGKVLYRKLMARLSLCEISLVS